MKRVLIFGHAGFSGFYMTRYLQTLPGITIFGVDLKKSNTIDEFQEDLTDFTGINRIIEQIRPDYIVNLSGLNHADDPAQLYAANIFPVINTIRSLNRNRFFETNLLTISSAAVYGDSGIDPITEEARVKPVNTYGASKLAMEQLVPVMSGNNKCKIMIARTFNLIGPGLSEMLSVPSFIKQLTKIGKRESDPIINVGNLKPGRDYVDIRDAVKAYWKIITGGKPGEIYNVGSGKSHKMKGILDIIIHVMGISVSVETDPNRVRKNEIMNSLADITKIKTLGWSPEIELETSIVDMIEYYQHGK